MSLTLKIPRSCVVGDQVMLPCHRTPDRYTMPIPTSLLSDEAALYLIYQELNDGWERRERDLLDEVLGPGSVFIDVGAHWGIHTLHAATAGAAVIAVEPDPFNRSMLSAWLTRNGLTGRVTVVDAAVGDMDGTAYLQRNTSMGHSLVFTPEDPDATYDGGPFDKQPMYTPTAIRRLDGIKLPEGAPVVLKVDVEGGELAVLRGAVGLLETGRVTQVIWEINTGYEAVSGFLSGYGYRTTRINSDNALSTLG
jgi:FkbM family methyltransferase